MVRQQPLVRIDPSELNRFKLQTDRYGNKLTTALRKKVKVAGQIGVDAVKAKLELPSPDGGPDTHKERDKLAAATKLVLSFSAKSAGVKISTSLSKLSDAHKAIARAYNTEEFHRGVLGGGYEIQRGRPYFGAAIEPAESKAMVDAINAALFEAAKTLGGRIK